MQTKLSVECGEYETINEIKRTPETTNRGLSNVKLKDIKGSFGPWNPIDVIIERIIS